MGPRRSRGEGIRVPPSVIHCVAVLPLRRRVAFVLIAAAVALIQLPIAAGAAAAGSVPVGVVDVVEVVGGGVRVAGWAMDPDVVESTTVHVYVDGRHVAIFSADGMRSDVGAAFGNGDRHGFDGVVSVGAGSHSVCVYGIDLTGDANRRLGCESFWRPPGDGETLGALRTSSGIVMPVVGDAGDRYVVKTACFNDLLVEKGRYEFIPAARVVIDPGHGGGESGAAANGLVEKHLNLDISLRVEAILEARGYSVELTRRSDYRVPLATRGEIAESLGAEAFVSIHHNGGATTRAGTPGTMTLYQHDLPESRRLATLLWEEMRNAALRHPTSWVSNSLTGASSRLSSPGKDFYGVHTRTPYIPSVITEWGYITNSYEAAQLKTETVKNAEAKAIADAIVRWFATSDTGSGDIGTWTDNTSIGTGGTSGCVDPVLP
jgi:N-acetylmuramoyl-L-alanine amidase